MNVMEVEIRQYQLISVLTLISVGGYFYSHCWFSLNNSEKVKAVTLAFCSIP